MHFVESAAELSSARPALDNTCFAAGDFEFTKAAARAIGVPFPEPPDYPPCLAPLLHRQLGTATLGEMPARVREAAATNDSVFIKPAGDVKAMGAIIEPQDGMLDFYLAGEPGLQHAISPSFPVFWAEVVDMRDEYRVYVVNGEVRTVCKYRRREECGGPPLDLGAVREAVRTFAASHPNEATGCALDFTITRKPAGASPDEGGPTWLYTNPVLIECNLGISLGRYEGISDDDFLELCLSRWGRLVGAR